MVLAPGDNVVVVTEAEVTRQAEGTFPTDEWVLYTRTAGTGVFDLGPGGPPAGTGSFHMDTPTGSDKVYLFNYEHTGTGLADIDGMSYATYRSSSSTGSAVQVPSINLEIDINGGALNSGEYAVLVFEPVYNVAQGAIADDTWQSWDAHNGGAAIWWSSRAIPGVCAFSCFVTWGAIVAANPDATILGGFGVNLGSGNAGIDAATDALGIGYGGDSVLYDFEAFRVATDREACKNGGWQDLTRADGSPFLNQGDCIQYVNTGN